jgi:hypothetical protein
VRLNSVPLPIFFDLSTCRPCRVRVYARCLLCVADCRGELRRSVRDARLNSGDAISASEFRPTTLYWGFRLTTSVHVGPTVCACARVGARVRVGVW